MSTGSEDRDRTTGSVLSVFTGSGIMQQIGSFDYSKHVILMKNKDSDMTSCHTSCFLREGSTSLCILLVHSSRLHAFLASTDILCIMYLLCNLALRRVQLRRLSAERKSKLEDSRRLQQFLRDVEEVKAWTTEKLQVLTSLSW